MKKFLILFVFILIISVNNPIVYSQTSGENGIDYYQNISSFDGAPTTTAITNSNTGDIGSVFNFLLTMMAIAIVILVIFRILQGAVIKGTFDNIYDSMKGKSIIQNAGLALIIFIFAYAILSFINPRLTGWNLATNFVNNIASRSTSGGAGICSPSKKYSNPNDIVEMLKQDEGVKNIAYYDSLGIPSIGVGYNLTRSSSVKSELIAAGVSEADATKLSSLKTDTSKAGQSISGYPQISNDIVNKLLLKDIEFHTKSYAVTFAKSAGKDYYSLPDNIKNVLTSMSFMGDYSDFVNMRDALKIDDYNGVAREIVKSKYCGQVGDRCSRLANLASPTYCQTTEQTSQSIYQQNSNITLPFTAQQAAKKILELNQQGKIDFPPLRSLNDKSDTKSQLQAIVDGKVAKLSSCSDRTNNNSGATTIDPKILNFLVLLADKAPGYQLNALANYCHSPNSNHYDGTAVDLGCSIPNLSSVADVVGLSVGVKRFTGERCGGPTNHWHYSTTGK